MRLPTALLLAALLQAAPPASSQSIRGVLGDAIDVKIRSKILYVTMEASGTQGGLRTYRFTGLVPGTTVRVMDVAGREVLKRSVEGDATFSTAGLSAGTYLVVVDAPGGRTARTLTVNR